MAESMVERVKAEELAEEIMASEIHVLDHPEAKLLARTVLRMKKALEFYADPFSQVDDYGEPVSVPDFYDEMEFGNTALTALSEGSAKDG